LKIFKYSKFPLFDPKTIFLGFKKLKMEGEPHCHQSSIENMQLEGKIDEKIVNLQDFFIFFPFFCFFPFFLIFDHLRGWNPMQKALRNWHMDILRGFWGWKPNFRRVQKRCTCQRAVGQILGFWLQRLGVDIFGDFLPFFGSKLTSIWPEVSKMVLWSKIARFLAEL